MMINLYAVQVRLDVAIFCQIKDMDMLHHILVAPKGKFPQPGQNGGVYFIPDRFLCFSVALDSLHEEESMMNYSDSAAAAEHKRRWGYSNWKITSSQ